MIPSRGMPMAVVVGRKTPVACRTIEVGNFGKRLQHSIVLVTGLLLHPRNGMIHEQHIHLNTQHKEHEHDSPN